MWLSWPCIGLGPGGLSRPRLLGRGPLGIGLGFISEVVAEEPTAEEGDIKIVKADTAEHRGDSFTKELSPQKFQSATSLLRVQPLSRLKAKL